MTIDVEQFNAAKDKGSAFDYLCEKLATGAKAKRTSEHKLMVYYKGDNICDYLNLKGLKGAVTKIDSNIRTISTGTWIVEVNTLVHSLTMKLNPNSRRIHGLD